MNQTDFTPRQYAAIRQRLLAWFDIHRRELPFRETRDPYHIWVSEVMLQQTTVAAVVPYFQRFIAAYPNVIDLAKAEESAVLKLWEGLGYYRRARHLHAAARILAEQFGTALPNDTEFWAELPGVGRYILGAVLSRSFDTKLPIVEANSLRVLARLFGYPNDPRIGEGKKWVWEKASRILPDKRSGDFNEAMMELGALICSPDHPKCNKCPLNRWCVAKKVGLQAQIPPKKVIPLLTSVREVAAVIRRGNTVLLGQRPHGVRWSGMWELPRGEIQNGERDPATVRRIAKELTNLTVKSGPLVSIVRHTITRFDVTIYAFETTAKGKPDSDFYTAMKWFTDHEAKAIPMAVPQRKLLKAVFADSE